MWGCINILLAVRVLRHSRGHRLRLQQPSERKEKRKKVRDFIWQKKEEEEEEEEEQPTQMNGEEKSVSEDCWNTVLGESHLSLFSATIFIPVYFSMGAQAEIISS